MRSWEAVEAIMLNFLDRRLTPRNRSCVCFLGFRTFDALVILAFFLINSRVCLGFQTGPEYFHEPPPAAISVSSLIPPDERVFAMPLAERIHLNAVPQRGMCSTIPAKEASNGLISGNGKMWVEVFGDPFSEQTIFHQEMLVQPWKTGTPLVAPKIAYVLPEVRRLMLAGEYKQALDLSLSAAEKQPFPSAKPNSDNLRDHPAFDMRIDTPGQHAVKDYLRTTDFESGEIKVVWTDKDGVWERRTFVSRPDNVIVQLLTSPRGSAWNATIQLDTSTVLHPPQHRDKSPVADGMLGPSARFSYEPGANEIQFTRDFDSRDLVIFGHYVVDKGNPGYASVTRVIVKGGQVSVHGDSLVLHGVHSLLMITRIEAYDNLMPSDVTALKTAVDAVTPDYQTLLQRNRVGQARVIDRVSVDFGASASMHSMSGEEMLTDQRIRYGYNPELLQDMVDMGRYWLYSRTGGEFPPMWGHVNINSNLQMSDAVMGDLPEAMKTYVQWVESQLPDARTNAQNIFGARGALFGIHPTQRGNPLTHFAYGWPHHYWISAGGWLYSPFWDYYLATGDRQFLRDHILPGLKEIALFYEDYLTVTDKNGYYIFVPSYSPENWPSNSQGAPAVINATMDIAVCRQVLTHLIDASQILGVDTEEIPRWKGILAKLPPYLLTTDGALKEWAWPTLEERLDHRHVSHLYGAWPADEITPDLTPDLARAALLAARKRAQGNASAHGLLHRSLAAARLKDSFLVNFDLKQLLDQGYVNPSLTTMHNPYRLPSPDPQGGIPTLIMEMLVYSRPGVIGLLPATPNTLTQGTVKGILCRTQAKIDNFKWNLKTRKASVTISSGIDQIITLYIRRGIESVSSSPGVLVHPVTPGSNKCTVRLMQAHPVTLNFTIGNNDPLDWTASTAGE